jgi:hypothetical protein
MVLGLSGSVTTRKTNGGFVPTKGTDVGTYLSYLRNLIFDEHVFVQFKEKRTVSWFFFYKKVGPDFPAKLSGS